MDYLYMDTSAINRADAGGTKLLDAYCKLAKVHGLKLPSPMSCWTSFSSAGRNAASLLR
jgi:hypothetical protein